MGCPLASNLSRHQRLAAANRSNRHDTISLFVLLASINYSVIEQIAQFDGLLNPLQLALQLALEFILLN